MRARGIEYPLITPAECESFDRVAHEDEKYARHDPDGEGVEYALIQPYDLARFCHTVRALRTELARISAIARRRGVERDRLALRESSR